jgi:hypothetical protein
MDLASMGKEISRPHSRTRRSNPGLPRMKTKLRIVSNIGLIVGQCVLLFVSRDIGLGIIICSSLMSVPFFLKEKMWDVLILIGFMQIINLTGLFIR